MTKKDDKNLDLEKKLEEIIKQKSDSESLDQATSHDKTVDWETMDWEELQSLKIKISELEKEKSELTEMAKRAQYDYINLKMDFDRFIRQTNEKNQTIWLDSLIDVVKKFLPFLEDLRKSLDNISDDHAQDSLTKWVQIVYDNFIKTLGSMNIYPIESLWQAPDTFYHEPVSTMPVEDENLKWKIVQEFERWFFWEKDWEKKLVISSKVVVGV